MAELSGAAADAATSEPGPDAMAWTADAPEQDRCSGCGSVDALRWNKFNQVTQCHRCGRVFGVPAADAATSPDETERAYPDRWRERISEAPKLLRDIARDIEPSHPMSSVTLGLVADDLVQQADELERLRAQANCGQGHDPERICCAHAKDVRELRAGVLQALNAGPDEDPVSAAEFVRQAADGFATKLAQMEQRAREIAEFFVNGMTADEAARHILTGEKPS